MKIHASSADSELWYRGYSDVKVFKCPRTEVPLEYFHPRPRHPHRSITPPSDVVDCNLCKPDLLDVADTCCLSHISYFSDFQQNGNQGLLYITILNMAATDICDSTAI